MNCDIALGLLLIALIISLILNFLDRRQVWKRVKKIDTPPAPPDIHTIDRT